MRDIERIDLKCRDNTHNNDTVWDINNYTEMGAIVAAARFNEISSGKQVK